MVYFKYVAVGGQGPLHVFYGLAVLYLIIHMEDPQLSSGGEFPDVFNAQVQKDSAVLSSGKGNIYVVEAVEYELQPAHSRIVYIKPFYHSFSAGDCNPSFRSFSIRSRS